MIIGIRVDTTTNRVFNINLGLGNKEIQQNLLVLDGMNEEAILTVDALEKLGLRLVEGEEACAIHHDSGAAVLVPIQHHELVKDIFDSVHRCSHVT